MTDHEFSGKSASEAAPTVAHLSSEERVKIGKDARALAPRSSQAEFVPMPDRPDPVSLLERQAATRVPELVPIRYGRMLVSPFTFYRGAALVMASDLAATPRSGLSVQVCGDAHLSNFGVFASPERRLMFDVNDFDETLPGPVGVGRQAAGRQRGDRRPGQRVHRQGGTARRPSRSGRRYRTRDAPASPAMSTLDVWYAPHRRRPAARRPRGDGRPAGPRPTSAWRADRQDAWPRPGPGTACRRWPS